MAAVYAREMEDRNDQAREISVQLGIKRDAADAEGVPGLSLAPEMLPDAPGMMDAPVVGRQGLDVHFNTRSITGDFSDRGVRLEAGGALGQDLSKSPMFYRLNAQARGPNWRGCRAARAARPF